MSASISKYLSEFIYLATEYKTDLFKKPVFFSAISTFVLSLKEITLISCSFRKSEYLKIHSSQNITNLQSIEEYFLI